MTETREDGRKRLTRRSVGYDIDVVGRLDRVTAPKQQRSEQRLQNVLAALETLLQNKTFSDISIPEIAAKANCSAATLYGRFKDKDSILAALHESLRERMIGIVDQALDPDKWRGKPLDELAAEYCTSTVTFYRRNRNLLAGALLISDKEVYERVALLIQHVSERFALAARASMENQAGVNLNARVELGIRAVFALLQQRLLFHPVRMSRLNDNNDAAFSADLARLLVQTCREI